MRHFDVQLVGGMVLHDGKIAEMKTGEGKTLAATLPAYLNALTGAGVHIVTVNDYLASRDADWMGKIYRFLGLSVGVNLPHMEPADKRKAYAADITYGTNNEFGFDYLRDNMAMHVDERFQRGLHYAIVDEVDSILIDEARTPLIISGQAEDRTEIYFRMNEVAPLLTRQKEERKQGEPEAPGDFFVDEKNHQILLSESGHQKAEEILARICMLPQGASLYEPAYINLVHQLYAALRAHHLFHRDQHYVVQDDQVIIVDEFTGRLMQGRRWSDGLHQAVQAVRPAPSLHQPAGELVDDDHLAVLHHVMLVAMEQVVRAQRRIQLVHQVDVRRLVQARAFRQQADTREDLLRFLVSSLREDNLVVLLVDEEIAGRLRLPLLSLFLLAREQRRHLVHAEIDLGAVLGLAGDDERRARLVDQDRIDLVDDGVMQPALEALVDVHRHVVAQIVEAEFVVGPVGDIRRVGLPLVRRLHVRQVYADAQAQEAIDLAHPVRVAARKIVVHRDDMHAGAGKRVEIRGQRRRQRLALAGLHLGDLAVVQHHASHQLHVEVAHAQGALRRFSDYCECFGQQLLQGRTFRIALFQLAGLRGQGSVRQLGDFRLQRIDLCDGTRIMLEQALVTAAEQPRRDAPENLEELAEEVDDLHELGGEALQPPKNAQFYHAPERTPRAAPLLRVRYGVGKNEKLRRVLRCAAEAHFEMQVRTGRAAGVAREGDAAAALQDVAFLHEQLGQVRIPRHQIVAVIDVDDIAVLRVEARKLHHARRGVDDGRAGVGEEVDALVHRPLPVERIDPLAESGSVVRSGHGQHGRHEFLLHRLLEELRFQHAKHVIAAFHLPRERKQLLVEVGERKVLRRHERGGGAAESGSLGEAELLRPHPRERGKTLPESIEARELGLHFSELDCHRVQVLLHEAARPLRLGFLGGEHQLLQHRNATTGARRPGIRGGAGAQHR